MLYEIATLACPLLALDQAAAGAEAWVKASDAKGEFLGCWGTELGTLGRLLVLRGFEDPADMTSERRRALLSANPFHAGQVVTSLAMDSYAPFPFLPPYRRIERAAMHEFRTYRLKPGGLSPTLAGWQAAIEPAHAYTAQLAIAMYALDGPTRITHLWGFDSLEQRADLRARAYDAGVWPPEGGPEQIMEATATIALPREPNLGQAAG